MNILITGAHGFVGSELAQDFQREYELETPTRQELDITDAYEVRERIEHSKPAYIIHAAAYTDASQAETERGDRKGDCYRVNVEGAKNVVSAAASIGARVIYISTGSVFSGTQSNPGPFREDDPVSSEDALSWYAYTKSEAEKIVLHEGGVVIRISHPVSGNNAHDYIRRYMRLLEQKKEYPLFTDQLFPLTGMTQFVAGVRRVLETGVTGVLHMTSVDLVSPYELFSYVCAMRGLTLPSYISCSFTDFIRTAQKPKRYAQFSAIVGEKTQAILSLPPYTWKSAVRTNMA